MLQFSESEIGGRRVFSVRYGARKRECVFASRNGAQGEAKGEVREDAKKTSPIFCRVFQMALSKPTQKVRLQWVLRKASLKGMKMKFNTR